MENSDYCTEGFQHCPGGSGSKERLAISHGFNLGVEEPSRGILGACQNKGSHIHKGAHTHITILARTFSEEIYFLRIDPHLTTVYKAVLNKPKAKPKVISVMIPLESLRSISHQQGKKKEQSDNQTGCKQSHSLARLIS